MVANEGIGDTICRIRTVFRLNAVAVHVLKEAPFAVTTGTALVFCRTGSLPDVVLTRAFAPIAALIVFLVFIAFKGLFGWGSRVLALALEDTLSPLVPEIARLAEAATNLCSKVVLIIVRFSKI